MTRNRRKEMIVWIAVGAAVVLLAAIPLIRQRAVPSDSQVPDYSQGMYYQGSYEPLELSTDALGDFPTQYHLDDIPWIATEESYSHPNSLQMIAARKGIEEPRGYFDFLMAFTYGALEHPTGLGFFPFTDPEIGFIAAAPYLGLSRRYYITDDEALYLDALRYYLSQGYPVRVALDAAVLYDLEELIPHSEVLVGYDEAALYYFETLCKFGIPCQPRRLPPGEEGLRVSDRTLLDAVLGQAKMLSYPWRYSFIIFEEGPLKDDLGLIWKRNGQSLIGGAQYGPPQGADAVEALATRIEERGIKVDVWMVHFELQMFAYTRRDNAAYLQEAFAGETDIERAASLFDEAGELYAGALAALEDGVAGQSEADKIGSMLRNAAALEREIGHIFLDK